MSHAGVPVDLTSLALLAAIDLDQLINGAAPSTEYLKAFTEKLKTSVDTQSDLPGERFELFPPEARVVAGAISHEYGSGNPLKNSITALISGAVQDLNRVNESTTPEDLARMKKMCLQIHKSLLNERAMALEEELEARRSSYRGEFWASA